MAEKKIHTITIMDKDNITFVEMILIFMVGFEMIDSLSRNEGILVNTLQSNSLIGLGSIGEAPILSAKPQTYMNFSGKSVGPLAAYYRVPLCYILLVYAETILPNGVLKLQPKGGLGHHNA
ncbi:chloroplastic group IIB intron splicing facilitator CRS2-B, chloroplastic-like [Vicia villosa]|uniref:chloroplastic group IIB intron splicing facilitator CRS2-B, chloroplastic-like n=1 Tax=Vicia villosa TaxID=3911 RepID=UPI00273BDFD5|nr:chloroplastic group IIB intron splicing facilitator CRS2-B, chloroplastic-like [Vicia villosa]